MNELADITTCFCGQKFTGPRLQVIGEPNARLRKYIEGLSQHFQEKHPDVARAMDAQALFYCGWLFLRNFRTTDPELKAERDRKRWEVHQQTLNARFSDESLTAQCRNLSQRLVDTVAALDHAAEGMVAHEDIVRSALECILIEVFTGMRNDLEEPGKYAEEKAVELVT